MLVTLFIALGLIAICTVFVEDHLRWRKVMAAHNRLLANIERQYQLRLEKAYRDWTPPLLPEPKFEVREDGRTWLTYSFDEPECDGPTTF